MTTLAATVRRAFAMMTGKGDANVLRAPGARTVEVSACASGTLVDFKLRVPAASRVDISSRLYFDDLATSGSPTFKVGLYGVDSNLADATTALVAAAAISSASAALGIIVPDDYANAGKTFWELAGGTGDPVGFFDVKGQVKAAAVNGAGLPGTITLDLKMYDD